MKVLVVFLCGFFLISCSSFESNLKKAARLSEQNKDQEALNLTLKAISKAKNIEQRKEALVFVADICERKLKDYNCAINSYTELLPLATSKQELESFHYKIGDIYFVDLQDYENALTSYSEVVETCADPLLCMESKVKISRSYYYKREFQQSINEIESLNKEQKDNNKILNKTKFVEASILHSQALMGLGKYAEAVLPLIEALSTFKDESNKQQVPILISVAYRENSEYQKALDILNIYKTENKDPIADVFIDSQLEKLQQRLEHQPGGPSGTKRRR
jgi:tetratricopeptide (TPR) repeat protein